MMIKLTKYLKESLSDISYDELCKMQKMQKNLSHEDIKWLKEYCYNQNALDLNNKLRKHEQLSNKDLQLITHLDLLIANNSLPVTVTVNRFIGLTDLYNITGVQNKINGETLQQTINRLNNELAKVQYLKTNNAFSSCSLNNGLFYRDRLKLVIKIHPGSRCLVPGNKIEQEIILPRNISLKLTDYTISHKSNYISIILYCDY